MASLVLGAVGGYFFGPIGFMIGSAIGSMLMPPKGQEGPRLTDLKLQTSQYGAMINILFGTIRSNNNTIQQTDLIEHKHKSGGKGGPSVTTYTYTASWICQLCDCQDTGPILGLNRIWADSRLIWSAVGNDPNAKQVPFTLYYGDETQLPDPTFEAIVGVGLQPAYRGTAYVTFTDMDLGDFGNRIPNLTFEVIASTNVHIQQVNQWSLPHAGGIGYLNGIVYDGNALHIATYQAGGPGLYTRDGYTFDGTYTGNELLTAIDSPNPNGGGWSPVQVQNSYAAALYCPDAGNITKQYNWAYDGAVCSGVLSSPVAISQVEFLIYGCPFYYNGYVYAVGGDLDCYVAQWDAPLGVPNGNIVNYYVLKANPSGALVINADVTVDDRGDVWVFGTIGVGSPAIWHLDRDLTLIAHYPENTTSLQYTTGLSEPTVYAGYVVSNSGTGNAVLSPCDGTFAAVQTFAGPPFNSGMLSLGGGFFATSDGMFKLPLGSTYADAVSVLSVAAGLSTGQIDVSQLGQPLAGYGISTRTTARDMIVPLQQADFFDAVESDLLVKFVKRGSQPVVIIPDADLGAFASGGEPPALLTVQRTQEVDLPQLVNTNYLNYAADYENGTQIAQRATTQSELQVTSNLPIVMTDNDAQQISYTTLYSAWLERELINARTPRKYAYLEPCDVVGVGNYLIRLTERTESTDNVIEWKGVVTLPQVFTQAAVPVSGGGFVPPTVPKTQLSDLLLLDSPLVTDDDFPNGYYAAMAGASDPSWRGAGLLKSIDGGVVYNQIATTDTDDSIGLATTALGNWTGPNIFDETNSVTVRMNAGAGALSSSNELGVLNGANEAALGINGRWEFIQYKNATLVSARTYTLSGLLRGRRGTEWAMGLHTISDNFVVLPVVVNVNGAFGELGLDREYKAVTVGNPTASAAVVSFTNNGMALLCYSPVQLGGGRDASSDIILTWIRRTRIGGAWLNFTDVPLGEINEAYVVTFYTNSGYGTIVYSVVVTSATTYTLSAADQTSFFGGLVGTLYWSVAQIGSYTVGTATRGVT